MADQSTPQPPTSNDQLVRGETPDDIAERALALCQSYIGGSWSEAHTTEDITVTRITGGLTNQLYRVQLKDTVRRVVNIIYPDDEPTDVALKIYMPKHMTVDGEDGAERLNDTIILTLMSHTGLSPQLYGIFSDGNIQAFLEHELFLPKYHDNPQILRKLAFQLAQINHLCVPIAKNSNVHTQTAKFLEMAYSNANVPKLINELNLEQLKRVDLRVELNNLVRSIEVQAAPVVFCHNDFFGSNIMIIGNDDGEKDIKIIDLEYSSYGPRGFDMAMLLTQYGRDPFDYENIQLPEDSVLERFAQYYIDGYDRIQAGYSNQSENSLLTHVREIKLSTLSYIMILLGFYIKQTESHLDHERFDLEENLQNVERLYQLYNQIKERLIKDGTLSRVV